VPLPNLPGVKSISPPKSCIGISISISNKLSPSLHLSSRPVNRIGVAEYSTEEEEEQEQEAEGGDGELGEIQKENARFIFQQRQRSPGSHHEAPAFKVKKGPGACARWIARQTVNGGMTGF
jgi:hypothetical protein